MWREQTALLNFKAVTKTDNRGRAPIEDGYEGAGPFSAGKGFDGCRTATSTRCVQARVLNDYVDNNGRNANVLRDICATGKQLVALEALLAASLD